MGCIQAKNIDKNNEKIEKADIIKIIPQQKPIQNLQIEEQKNISQSTDITNNHMKKTNTFFLRYKFSNYNIMVNYLINEDLNNALKKNINHKQLIYEIQFKEINNEKNILSIKEFIKVSEQIYEKIEEIICTENQDDIEQIYQQMKQSLNQAQDLNFEINQDNYAQINFDLLYIIFLFYHYIVFYQKLEQEIIQLSEIQKIQEQLQEVLQKEQEKIQKYQHLQDQIFLINLAKHNNPQEELDSISQNIVNMNTNYLQMKQNNNIIQYEDNMTISKKVLQVDDYIHKKKEQFINDQSQIKIQKENHLYSSNRYDTSFKVVKKSDNLSFNAYSSLRSPIEQLNCPKSILQKLESQQIRQKLQFGNNNNY